MFMLTTTEVTLLTVGWLSLTGALLLGVFRFLPRSRRPVPAVVTCPLLNRRVLAELLRDEWTRSFREVVRCDTLGRCAPVTCNQRCLAASPVRSLAAV
jgi:hypothetical protein